MRKCDISFIFSLILVNFDCFHEIMPLFYCYEPPLFKKVCRIMSNLRYELKNLDCITQNEAQCQRLNLVEAVKPQLNGLLLTAISTMSHILVYFSKTLKVIEISFGPRMDIM